MTGLLNRLAVLGVALAALCPAVRAGIYYSDFSYVSGDPGGEYLYRASSLSGSQVIYDNNASGVAYALNFNNAALSAITGVSVTFSVSGGWNGDVYAYLSHGDGLAVLLNRVGADGGNPDGYGGAGNSGFSTITLTSGGTAGDIHWVSAPTSGNNYSADGRLVYTDTTRNNTLDVFSNGALNPNGSWTLFFADVRPLSEGTLTGFSVDVTAVPEPVPVALGIFGVLLAGVRLGQRWVQRNCPAEGVPGK